jgi:hypothetical protein
MAEGTLFRAPWEAQAFAMAVVFSRDWRHVSIVSKTFF